MAECCDDPFHPAEDYTYQHEGDTVEVYTTCENCGEEHKDVFAFSHTEVVEEGDGGERRP